MPPLFGVWMRDASDRSLTNDTRWKQGVGHWSRILE